MASIIKPERMNFYVARHHEVQRKLAQEAGRIFSKTKAIHAMHRDTGASYVGLEHGWVDWHIFLDDTRGVNAALSIEYGHTTKDGTWVEGIHALTLPGGALRT